MSNEKENSPAPVKTPTIVVPPSDYSAPALLASKVADPLTPSPVAVSDMGNVADVVLNPVATDSKSGYPIILNGDHAEFEAEYAGKDPKTRPDWPMPSMDAKDWAEAFADVFKGKIMVKRDDLVGTMLAWFSGALMRGYDEARAHGSKELESIMADVRTQVEKEKSDLEASLWERINEVATEAKTGGKAVWLKYGGVLILGIAIGSTFMEYFRSIPTP